MRRIFVLTAALTLLLTACTSGTPADSEAPSTTAAQTSTPEADAPSSTPGPESTAPEGQSAPESADPAETAASASSAPETSPPPEIFAPAQTPESTKPTEEQESSTMTITINSQTFLATLYDNETATALKAKLPLTLDMSELNGNEKYNYLPFSLPANAGNPGQIHAGDLMLYGSNCLVLFYESFSTGYSYTPIGRVDNPSGLAAAAGSGDVQVAFALG